MVLLNFRSKKKKSQKNKNLKNHESKGVGFHAADALTSILQQAASQGALIIKEKTNRSPSAEGMSKQEDWGNDVQRKGSDVEKLFAVRGKEDNCDKEVTLSLGGTRMGPSNHMGVGEKAIGDFENLVTASTISGGSQHKLGKVAVMGKQQPDLDRHEGAGMNRSFLSVLQGEAGHQTQAGSAGGAVVRVNPDLLRKRLDICKFSVVGRIILAKGDEPWNLSKLKDKLSMVWALRSAWRLISLGKGFYHIILSSAEERDRIWSRGSVNLKPGVMRLQRWTFGFDPLKEKTTHAQVWIRLYHLPWCLWDPTILVDIARKIGTPLKFDRATVEGDFGHFARILVDVDLSKPVKTSVILECGEVTFDVKVVSEKMPAFCKACGTIGHVSTECRSLNRGLVGGRKEHPVQGVQKNPIVVEEEDNKIGSDRSSRMGMDDSPALPLVANRVIPEETGVILPRELSPGGVEVAMEEVPEAPEAAPKVQDTNAQERQEDVGEDEIPWSPVALEVVGEGQIGTQAGSRSMSSGRVRARVQDIQRELSGLVQMPVARVGEQGVPRHIDSVEPGSGLGNLVGRIEEAGDIGEADWADVAEEEDKWTEVRSKKKAYRQFPPSRPSTRSQSQQKQ